MNLVKERLERARTDQYGPAPTNPFKKLRTDHKFTLDNLCSRIYISKQALIRLEQGTYDNPLPAVLEWWANHVCSSKDCPANNPELLRPGTPIGELYLRDAYSEFQTLQRERHYKCFGPSLVLNDVEAERCLVERYHPFRLLRDRAYMSVTEVAKSLCIPQATVEHFEKKYKTQQTVPKNLRYALKEVGYSSDEIAWLNTAYSEYRNNNRSIITYDSGGVGAINASTFGRLA